MTSFILRLIAIICMLIDHTAHCLVDDSSQLYIWMRIIGRLAFPIFCFLIVEGFLHTRCVWKYALRLAIFALISELPFDLAFNDGSFALGGGQNVFVTLLLGLFAIWFAGRASGPLMKALKVPDKYADNHYLQCLIGAPVAALLCWGAALLYTDYDWRGVLIIFCLYLFKNNRPFAMAVFVWLNFMFLCYMSINSVQIFASLAAVPLLLYNGKPGSKSLKYLFYSFYPAHLVILWLLDSYVFIGV